MSYFIYEGKRVFYSESGEKKQPLIFLHGNTASSRMFELVKSFYDDSFNRVFIDFLGHGRSDRLDSFPPDLWMYEARQTVALMEHLGYRKIIS